MSKKRKLPDHMKARAKQVQKSHAHLLARDQKYATSLHKDRLGTLQQHVSRALAPKPPAPKIAKRGGTAGPTVIKTRGLP